MLRSGFLLLLSFGLLNGQADPKRFAASIAAFHTQDQVQPPPKQAILFIGSSIFRLWNDLKEQMAPLPVFNRAFGGSQTADLLFYMDQVVLPYEPRMIVYYCGSNDINAGIGPDRIFDGFRRFVERVHDKLPETRVVFVSIHRAPQKKAQWDQVNEANRLVEQYCRRNKLLAYVDVNPAIFDREGNPRLDLYLPDLLHFKAPAYVGFTAILKPELEKLWASAR